MKKTNILNILFLLSITLLLACSNESGKQTPVRVELMSSSWLLKTPQPAQSTLTTQLPQAELVAPDDIEKGFAIKFTVDLKKIDSEETILEIPQIVNVKLRQHDAQRRERQNYPAFKMTD